MMISTNLVSGYQVQCEPEAGQTIATSELWWGTRVRYRPVSGRKWSHVLLIDVHPFDRDVIAAGVRAHIERNAAPKREAATPASETGS
jgi:hypothetical protein